MLFSKNVTFDKNANNLICCVFFEIWDVIENNDVRFFLLQKYFCEFVFVIMLDHFIVYVSIVWLEIFRDNECLTRTTHQTWRKRLIKLDTSDISSSFISDISSNLIKLIFHQIDMSSNFDERCLIKFDENFVCSLWWAFLKDKRECRVRLSLLCKNVDRQVFKNLNEDFFVMSVLRWKLRRWHTLAFLRRDENLIVFIALLFEFIICWRYRW
jgi:hypothetical protein